MNNTLNIVVVIITTTAMYTTTFSVNLVISYFSVEI